MHNLSEDLHPLSPNALIIYFPLLENIKAINITNKSFVLEPELDKNAIFGKFYRKILLNKRIHLNRKSYKEFIKSDKVLSNIFKKTLLNFSIYAIEPLNVNPSQLFPILFIQLDLFFEKETNLIYVINRFFNNRQHFRKFLLKLIDEEHISDEDNKEITDILKTYEDPFIFFNILYYNFIDECSRLARYYHTGNRVLSEPQFDIFADSRGQILLFVNHIKTKNSSRNLKIISLRCFLIRYFAILSRSEIPQQRSGWLDSFLQYYYYMLNGSRNKNIYTELVKLSFFKIHQSSKLVIFDTLNQTMFLNKDLCEKRVKALEDFIFGSGKREQLILKYAFIIESKLSGISKSIDLLDKNGWFLIYTTKEKKTDYDTAITTLIETLSNLNKNSWDKVFLITSDSDLIKYSIAKFGPMSTSVYFIALGADLKTQFSLTEIETGKYEFKIFKYHISKSIKIDL